MKAESTESTRERCLGSVMVVEKESMKVKLTDSQKGMSIAENSELLMDLQRDRVSVHLMD